jgi:DNA (cytosine-5)-methyltransferase 1
MDLRDFNQLGELPSKFYELDILDGSPPCSTFSTVGKREKFWGIEKRFKEGQKKQTLDDLFFVFLDTVEKLRPKIVIAENVAGLLYGNARGYVREILARFKELGYEVQLFKLNAAFMDVPQKRERVFFIANRCGYPALKLNFNHTPAIFGKVRTAEGKEIAPGSKLAMRMKYVKPGDRLLKSVMIRMYGEKSNYGTILVPDSHICNTITSSGSFVRLADKMLFSDNDFINVQSFPQDYNFCGNSVQYVCGMSVPPNMMANIAGEIWRQWLA